MDRIINYFSCVIGCSLPGIIVLAGMFAAMGLLLSALALVGIATLVTIPGIWAIIAAAYGVSVAAIIVACLLSCGFRTTEPPAGGGEAPASSGAVAFWGASRIAEVRLGIVALALTIWSVWDKIF